MMAGAIGAVVIDPVGGGKVQLPAFLNKERVVFLVAAVIFLIGLTTMLTRAPLGKEVPAVPPVPAPEDRVEVRTRDPLFPAPPPEYTRSSPFSLREVWGPPNPGRLPSLPLPQAGYAVPRATLKDGFRPDVHAMQIRPPVEVVEEGTEGEGEGEEETDDSGESEG